MDYSPNSSSSIFRWWLIVVLLAFFFSPRVLGIMEIAGGGCSFTSIFNFGDSLSDTGNLLNACSSNEPSDSCFLPYGETFFHRPTGRFSDGRLIIDFIAQSMGVPLLQPYLGVVKRQGNNKLALAVEDFEKGLNFAVVGATALDGSYLKEKGIVNVPTNDSLSVQMEWFRNAYSSVCTSTSTTRCRNILKSSLVLVGEIGGNDYNYPFFQLHSFEEIKSFVPLVIKVIASTITELIQLGAETLMVPGNLPIGCNPTYLRIYENSAPVDKNGCLNWLNQFSEYHNEHLQQELNQIRTRHPHVHIVYADYYNSAMRFYNDPEKFGFRNTLEACLVERHSHETMKKHRKHGVTSKPVCDDPSKYVSWDGIHLTEAAYKVIANGLLQGPYTNPQITTSCISKNSTTNLLQFQ